MGTRTNVWNQTTNAWKGIARQRRTARQPYGIPQVVTVELAVNRNKMGYFSAGTVSNRQPAQRGWQNRPQRRSSAASQRQANRKRTGTTSRTVVALPRCGGNKPRACVEQKQVSNANQRRTNNAQASNNRQTVQRQTGSLVNAR